MTVTAAQAQATIEKARQRGLKGPKIPRPAKGAGRPCYCGGWERLQSGGTYRYIGRLLVYDNVCCRPGCKALFTEIEIVE